MSLNRFGLTLKVVRYSPESRNVCHKICRSNLRLLLTHNSVKRQRVENFMLAAHWQNNSTQHLIPIIIY